MIIEHITYDLLDETYDDRIFTDHTLKGKLGANAVSVNRIIYDNIVYDSKNEEQFVKQLDTSDEVVVYAKFPSDFYISTPVDKYNPDWAIAFREDAVKHIYLIAKTKGSMSTMTLRGVESLKIRCAREHFKRISSDTVRYDVVDNYDGNSYMNEIEALKMIERLQSENNSLSNENAEILEDDNYNPIDSDFSKDYYYTRDDDVFS